MDAGRPWRQREQQGARRCGARRPGSAVAPRFRGCVARTDRPAQPEAVRSCPDGVVVVNRRVSVPMEKVGVLGPESLWRVAIWLRKRRAYWLARRIKNL